VVAVEPVAVLDVSEVQGPNVLGNAAGRDRVPMFGDRAARFFLG
jgi:hypothetical protein